MPSGKTHDAVNICIGLLIMVPVVAFTAAHGRSDLALAFYAGAAVSTYINPDISCTEYSRSRHRFKSLFLIGPIYAWVFDVLAYRVTHRHYLSHSIIGTVIRVALFLPLIAPILAVLRLAWPGLYLTILLFFLIGWFAFDQVHTSLDFSVSYFRR